MSVKIGKISWDKFYKNVTADMDVDLCKKFRCGIKTHIKSYVMGKYPAAISEKGGQILVDKAIDTENFRKEYFRKTEADYSAKDIVTHLLNHIGIPPVDTMSQESLEKAVLTLLDSAYKSKVYIKRVQGRHNTYCVDCDTAEKIERNADIQRLVKKQIKKAEQKSKGSDSVNWKCYEHEESFIQSREELSGEQGSGGVDEIQGLSCEEKTFCMTQALFSLFFTDFDFVSLSRDIEEYNLSETAMDFGERYQKLEEIFSAPHFDWKYYKIKEAESDSVLDRLAKKIAEKILKRISEKGS